MSRALFVVALLAGWILLWGELSLANILTGMVLIAVLFTLLPGGRPDTAAVPLRPVALMRLTGFFVVDLLWSNVILARMVLRRRIAPTSGVITVTVADCSPGMLAFIANLIALSPGTMTVATSASPPRLHVHVVDLDDSDDASRRITHLADRAIAAFGTMPGRQASTAPPTASARPESTGDGEPGAR